MLRRVILFQFLCFGEYVFSNVDENPQEEDWINPLDGFFGSYNMPDNIVERQKSETNMETPIDEGNINVKNAFETDGVGALVYSSMNIHNLKSSLENDNILADKNLFLCNTFLRRFINIILQSTGLKDHNAHDVQSKEIPLKLKISEEALSILQKFGAGQSYSFDELDEHLVQFLKFEFETVDKVEYFNFLSNLGSILFEARIYLVCILLTLIPVYFFRKGITLSSFITFLFLTYYVSSVGLDLLNQYEDAYSKRILSLEETLSHGGKEKIPDECFDSKMSKLDRFINMYIYRDNACDRYLKSKKSIWSEIDIQKAFSGPLNGLLFSSIPHLGDVTGKAVKNFSDHFLFPFNWIIALIVVYFIITTGFSTLMSLSVHAIPHQLFRHRREDSSCCIGDNHRNNQLQGSPNVQSGVTINYHLPPSGLPHLSVPSQPTGDLSILPRKTSGSKEIRKCQELRRDRKRALLYTKLAKLK